MTLIDGPVGNDGERFLPGKNLTICDLDFFTAYQDKRWSLEICMQRQ